MQATNIPAKIPLPFANSGTKNVIPSASQISITPGAASLTDGFPPLTFTPLASGGVPPGGADFNGIFNVITAIQQWQCAGGSFKYDSAFSAAVGGYPKGAVLINITNDGMWLNLLDANATNPDATDGTAANWSPVDAYGSSAVALSNANVTLTPAQFARPIIILSGALTSNVQITFPKLIGQWYVVNATTGAFAASVLTLGGTSVVVGQGLSAVMRGDGTNVLNDAIQIGAGSSAPTPPQSDNSTKIPTTAWVANQGYVQSSQVQSGSAVSAISAGSADVITAAFTPTITSLTNGMTLTVRAGFANTTTTPTFAADGTMARTIVKGNNLPLIAGDISGSRHWMILIYDATLTAWVLENPTVISISQVNTAINTAMQSSAPTISLDTGVVNAYVAALTPAITTPIAGVPIFIKVKTTNTGASTLNVTGTVYPLLGAAHSALQGGEMLVNGWALVEWNATLTSWVLIICTGGAHQVALATQTNHAMTLGQSLGYQQTWRDVTASRALSTTYTNSFSRPILVLVSLYIGVSSTTNTSSFSVGGVIFAKSQASNNTGTDFNTVVYSVLIPAGSTYSVACTQNLLQWSELS